MIRLDPLLVPVILGIQVPFRQTFCEFLRMPPLNLPMRARL